MKPLIGITTSLTDDEQRLDHRYVRAVAAAGGIPVIVPMLDSDEASAAFASIIDALIITGGPAITIGLIGALPADIAVPSPVRIASDLSMLQVTRGAGKPILGICYGMQLVNAACGGKIFADCQAQVSGSLCHSEKRGGKDHSIRFGSDTILRRLVAQETAVVNTRHIQAVATVGAGLSASAFAEDGTIEAIENDRGDVMGVQFHIERMGRTGAPLFAHIVREALRKKQEASVAS